jgi:AraC family transcriptional regulator
MSKRNLKQNKSAIHPLLPSPLISSQGLGWKSVILERHVVPPCELPEAPVSHHIVECMLGEHWFYGERRNLLGNFTPYSLPPESINLYPDGTRPALRSFTRTDLILIGLETQLIKEVSTDLERSSGSIKPLREQVGFRDEQIRGLTKLLEFEASTGEQTNSLFVDHVAYALVVALFCLKRNQLNEPSHKVPPLSSSILRRVIERMRADLHTDLDLKELAAESGYSRNHFLRMFYASTRSTPHQYLLRLRAEKAQSMLKNKSLTMSDIAKACGFAGPSHFSRVFRKIHGIPPSEYRREIQLRS